MRSTMSYEEILKETQEDPKFNTLKILITVGKL